MQAGCMHNIHQRTAQGMWRSTGACMACTTGSTCLRSKFSGPKGGRHMRQFICVAHARKKKQKPHPATFSAKAASHPCSQDITWEKQAGHAPGHVLLPALGPARFLACSQARHDNNLCLVTSSHHLPPHVQHAPGMSKMIWPLVSASVKLPGSSSPSVLTVECGSGSLVKSRSGGLSRSMASGTTCCWRCWRCWRCSWRCCRRCTRLDS